MKAGLGKAAITPPVGTRMEGWWGLQRDPRGARSVHDELFVRALYCEHGDQTVLILAFDVLFFSRETADRLKAAVGRDLDLSPRQILINASHTHCSPQASHYLNHRSRVPDWAWLEQVETAVQEAADQARRRARPVTVCAGATTTRLPMSRRRPVPGQGILFRPYPDGKTYDRVPVCLLRDQADQAVCLLFSVSCHPSTFPVKAFSADYPGVACSEIDAHLGGEASMFLQGVGGDAKACVIGERGGVPEPTWRSGTWEDVLVAGRMVAQDVLAALPSLKPVKPALDAAITEIKLPLQKPLPDREALTKFLSDPYPPRRMWARMQLRRLKQGVPLKDSARVLVQGVRLGQGVRLVALEGEPVAAWGPRIQRRFRTGVTFPLGYSNGMGLYLPTSAMIDEGGYEVTSPWEYGYPAVLSKGLEPRVGKALSVLGQQGIV